MSICHLSWDAWSEVCVRVAVGIHGESDLVTSTVRQHGPVETWTRRDQDGRCVSTSRVLV